MLYATVPAVMAEVVVALRLSLKKCRCIRFLEKAGVPLATAQVQFSLLSRGPDQMTTQAVCRDLGITMIAYSPLGLGALSCVDAVCSKQAYNCSIKTALQMPVCEPSMCRLALWHATPATTTCQQIIRC